MKKSQKEILAKTSYKNWCNLIAWLINSDALHFSRPLERNITSDDIWRSNPNGELMFLGESIRFLTHILEQIIEIKDLGSTEQLIDNIFEILGGKKIDPDAKYASGFGLKCETILLKCENDYIEKVNKLLKDTWGSKND